MKTEAGIAGASLPLHGFEWRFLSLRWSSLGLLHALAFKVLGLT